jgi:hypothetical protein
MSSSVPTLLMQIFVPSVSFVAGTTFDIRTFNGTSLGATSLFSAVLGGQGGGPLTLTPNITLAANTMYAIAVVGTNIPSAGVDAAFAGGSIFVRNDALSPWVNQNVDVAGFSVTTSPVTATPEPGSVALLATGFVGLGGVGFRRRNRSAACASAVPH